MRPDTRLLAAAALTCWSVATSASTAVYPSASEFLGLLSPGAYTESFDGQANPPAGAVTFSGSGFSYSAFTPSDIYLAGGFLGANQVGESLTLTFTSGNVYGVGANFYATDISDAFQSVTVSLTLSDGTVESFTPTSIADAYRGFVSTTPISSIVIGGTQASSLYIGLDNLTVGAVSAVPEPSQLALLMAGAAGLLVLRRRAS